MNSTQAPVLPFPRREMAPPSHRMWVKQTSDQWASLMEEFQDWHKFVSGNEQLFKQHVYDNPEADEHDYRQHRARLCEMLAGGENLILDFRYVGSRLDRLEEADPYINLIEQELKRLWNLLFKWHGPLESQGDVPESFKQAARELAAGNLVDG